MKRVALMLWVNASLLFGVMASNPDELIGSSIFSEWHICSELSDCNKESTFCLGSSIDSESTVCLELIFGICITFCQRVAGDFVALSYRIFNNLNTEEQNNILSSISLREYNGKKLKFPLELGYHMPKKQVIAAIFSAFGDDVKIRIDSGVYDDLDYTSFGREILTKNDLTQIF